MLIHSQSGVIYLFCRIISTPVHALNGRLTQGKALTFQPKAEPSHQPPLRRSLDANAFIAAGICCAQVGNGEISTVDLVSVRLHPMHIPSGRTHDAILSHRSTNYQILSFQRPDSQRRVLLWMEREEFFKKKANAFRRQVRRKYCVSATSHSSLWNLYRVHIIIENNEPHETASPKSNSQSLPFTHALCLR